MKRLLPLILLFLIGSVFAGEFQTLRQAPAALRVYMSLSARTYNSGKECRHAAAEVVTLAGQEGLPARVPIEQVDDRPGGVEQFPERSGDRRVARGVHEQSAGERVGDDEVTLVDV